jgi:preprotein translocase subunit SecD
VALCVIMIALSKLPGTLFFPVLGCSVVLLDNLFAHFVWQERLTRPAVAGVGIAILSLALVI